MKQANKDLKKRRNCISHLFDLRWSISCLVFCCFKLSLLLSPISLIFFSFSFYVHFALFFFSLAQNSFWWLWLLLTDREVYVHFFSFCKRHVFAIDSVLLLNWNDIPTINKFSAIWNFIPFFVCLKPGLIFSDFIRNCFSFLPTANMDIRDVFAYFHFFLWFEFSRFLLVFLVIVGQPAANLKHLRFKLRVMLTCSLRRVACFRDSFVEHGILPAGCNDFF